MSRSASELQAAVGQLDRVRLAAPKSRANVGESCPMPVTGCFIQHWIPIVGFG